jgi:hypothetical protein
MDNEVVLTTGDFWLQTNGGDVYPTNVEKDGNTYTLTFDAAMETLKTFTVQINSTMGAVTLDDIRICTEQTPVEPADPNLIQDFADGDLSNVVIATGTLSVQQIADENWLTISCGAPDWLYLKNLNYSNGKQMQAIQIELKTEAVLTAGSVYLYTDAGAFYASGVTREGDVYTFTFNTAFTTLNEVSMLVNENTTLQIKQILAVE